MFNSALVDLYPAPAREHGVDALADRIAMYVDSLVPQGRARCLDVGCGDLALAEAVERRKSRTDWQCIDVHRSCGSRMLPYGDGEFDVALMCDVLHRAPADAARLLAEAARVARHVLVKDHFGHGHSCGAEIPCRYFTRESFVRLVSEQGLYITALDCELDLVEQAYGARLLPKPVRAFIAVVNR